MRVERQKSKIGLAFLDPLHLAILSGSKPLLQDQLKRTRAITQQGTFADYCALLLKFPRALNIPGIQHRLPRSRIAFYI